MEQSPSFSSSATKASTGEMVLKVQQSEGTRRSTRLSSVNMEGKRIVSVKKSKTKQKKKSAKVDSKIPKKPPTAFFYFLVSNVHKVVQARKASTLLALAMGRLVLARLRDEPKGVKTGMCMACNSPKRLEI